MKIGIDMNVGQVTRWMSDVERKQVPYAMALAMTRTAQEVKRMEEREMRDVFDRPTPYTMSALFLRRATKARMEAEVGIKDDAAKAIAAAKYLRPQIHGGGRNLKRFELALRSVGVLPSGYVVVPGEAAALDQYGNLSRGLIVQILSYFRAFPEVGYKANMIDKRRASLAKGSAKKYGVVYFSVQPGDANTRRRGLLPGIWKREIHGFGSRIRPVLIFVSRTRYEPTFDFHYVAQRTVQKELQPQFERAFAEAMRTAK